MKYSNIKYYSTTNGDGFRTCLFVSGCNLHCKGCFNQKAWDFNWGKEFDQEVINKILKSIEPEYIQGLSILGGEPMDEKNQEGVWDIIKAFRERFGNTKDIWMWSGFYIEKMPKTVYKDKILNELDILIDGPFEIEKSKIGLKYKGSDNQRVLNMKKTIEDRKITLLN